MYGVNKEVETHSHTLPILYTAHSRDYDGVERRRQSETGESHISVSRLSE
jgi:hypothetical protein